MEHQHYEASLNAGGAHHHLYHDMTPCSDVFFRNLAKISLGETVLKYDLCNSLAPRMNQVDWIENKLEAQDISIRTSVRLGAYIVRGSEGTAAITASSWGQANYSSRSPSMTWMNVRDSGGTSAKPVG